MKGAPENSQKTYSMGGERGGCAGRAPMGQTMNNKNVRVFSAWLSCVWTRPRASRAPGLIYGRQFLSEGAASKAAASSWNFPNLVVPFGVFGPVGIHLSYPDPRLRRLRIRDYGGHGSISMSTNLSWKKMKETGSRTINACIMYRAAW